jgi:hypothetical protein
MVHANRTEGYQVIFCGHQPAQQDLLIVGMIFVNRRMRGTPAVPKQHKGLFLQDLRS